MDQITLAAKPREARGGQAVKKLRKAGKIPGVVYGREFGDPLPVVIDARDLRAALQGHGLNAVINLDIEGRGRTPVMVHEHQIDVVTRRFIHVDLHAINLNEEVEAQVRLVPVGSAPGVRDGGILDLVLHEITVSALPGKIPEHIEIDVGELRINDTLHVSDLVVPAGVKIVDDPGDIVVSLHPPTKVEEPVAAVPEPTEPELIGEKKPVEEEIPEA